MATAGTRRRQHVNALGVDILAACAQRRRYKTLRQRVDTKFATDSLTGCWNWTGKLAKDGYGRFSVDRNLCVAAHRAVYTAYVGPIPQGLTLDHLCRNKSCVNPAHLEPVTSRTNTLRGEGPAALNAAKTECVHGHPLSGDNVYATRSGKRHCRTCLRAGWRAYQKRQRGLA